MPYRANLQALFRRTVDGRDREDIREDAVSARAAAQVALAKRRERSDGQNRKDAP
jgi:hypothetical protein